MYLYSQILARLWQLLWRVWEPQVSPHGERAQAAVKLTIGQAARDRRHQMLHRPGATRQRKKSILFVAWQRRRHGLRSACTI